MARHLRQILTASVFLISACGAGAAGAVNCAVGGGFPVSLSPCPVSKQVKYGTSITVSSVATIGVTPPSAIYIAARATSADFKTGAFSAFFTSKNKLTISIGTAPTLGIGHHTGTLDMRFCKDKNCSSLLADVQLPYTLDVSVPPVISQLSPASVLVGTPTFILKISGSNFSSGSTVRFGSDSLPATFVSSAELTAKVNLTAVTLGQTYKVSVVPSSGFVSNTANFALENPLPVVTQISPASRTVGTPAFTLTVTGKHFMPGSSIYFAGSALTTTFISSTELQANVKPGSQTGASYAVSVVSPKPGGGVSNRETFALMNRVPAISGISPDSWLARGRFFTLTVNGSGFQTNSVVQLSVATNIPYRTTYVSPTELQVQTVSYFGPPVDATVSVANPSPGGGTSNGETLEFNSPAPTLAWVTPIRAYAGSGDLTLTVQGTNFTQDTLLELNGTPLVITSKNTNAVENWLQATVPASTLATAGTAIISAVNPAPGGGTASLPYTIELHPPEIDSLSPGFVAPGGGDFTLTVYGADFDPTATVYWNGDALTTAFVSSDELQATVPAAETASPGVARVTVVNPPAAGGVSVPATFAMDASGSAVGSLAQPVNDIEWDSANFVFYGSIPVTSSIDPDSIATIDPIAATVTNSIGSTDEPGLLSVSGDSQFLYVAFPGRVERLSLPTFALDISIPFFNVNNSLYVAKALAVSPAYPHVVAIAIGAQGNAFATGTLNVDTNSILINDVFEQTWNVMDWSPDGNTLYAGQSMLIPLGDFYYVDLNQTGVFSGSGSGSDPIWAGSRMHVDRTSGLIYADNSPSVIDLKNLSTFVTFPLSGVMVPDSALGCAYFITQVPAQLGTTDYTLSCYSTTDQTLTRSLVIPAVNGVPTKLMRWGNEGLVFITDAGSIYFVSGQIVTGN